MEANCLLLDILSNCSLLDAWFIASSNKILLYASIVSNDISLLEMGIGDGKAVEEFLGSAHQISKLWQSHETGI